MYPLFKESVPIPARRAGVGAETLCARCPLQEAE
jgi:hypothetical protein